MREKRSNSTKTPSRAGGRPSSLTLDKILQAAIEMGVTGFSMPTLAKRLGIATATLYNYVDNRDDLLRLVALKRARQPKLDDLGQDWPTYVRAHAIRFYEFWSSEPELMIQYMQGAIGPEAVFEHVESFLEAMSRRGFEPNDAYKIFSSVNTVVFGAVVRNSYLSALRSKGVGHGEALRRSLYERNPEELPHVRACSEFANEERAYDFNKELERVMASFVAEFGSRES